MQRKLYILLFQDINEESYPLSLDEISAVIELKPAHTEKIQRLGLDEVVTLASEHLEVRRVQ